MAADALAAGGHPVHPPPAAAAVHPLEAKLIIATAIFFILMAALCWCCYHAGYLQAQIDAIKDLSGFTITARVDVGSNHGPTHAPEAPEAPQGKPEAAE